MLNLIKNELKVSEDTDLLLNKRREMTGDKSRNNYSEICKTIRKRLRQDIREYNAETLREAAENNSIMRKAKRGTCYRLKLIVYIKVKKGDVVRDISSGLLQDSSGLKEKKIVEFQIYFTI